jgi:hypothetical protein
MRDPFEHNRRTLVGFEIIDFAEDTELDAVRSKLDVAAATEVRWNGWEYGSHISELRRLYEKGKKAQWNATEDLDWRIPVSKDEWIGSPDASAPCSCTPWYRTSSG